jgi:type VI secretion system protein VasJ
VLGSIKSKSPWEWSASGKHPVAMDYFQLGDIAPLTQAFAAWIEKGYQKLLAQNHAGRKFHSWRFWARGIRKGHIACGVGRDSTDSAGRPYPLLIMGTGTLPGWEENWDLLTFLFEGIWSQIEYLASRPLADLKQLESEISRINMPNEDWSALAAQGLSTAGPGHGNDQNGHTSTFGTIEGAAEALLMSNEFLVSIDPHHNGDASSLVGFWNRALKSRTNIVPNAVFMGGIPEQTYLALFTRSLNSSDFERLWSVSSA